jgi:hypothetical protein
MPISEVSEKNNNLTKANLYLPLTPDLSIATSRHFKKAKRKEEVKFTLIAIFFL